VRRDEYAQVASDLEPLLSDPILNSRQRQILATAQATCALLSSTEVDTRRVHRNPDGPGFIGTDTFDYAVEYGVFRYDMENLRGTFAYAEEAIAYAEAHNYTCIASRRVPVTPEWERI
jgi:hypothetical protein